MKTLEFIYQETQIHFLLNQDTDVMVNATEMAKMFGKRTEDYLRLKSTQELINEILEDEKSRNIHAHLREYLTKDDIILTSKRGGTYMHKILALDFAAWLDVKFRIWVLRTLDNIILSRFNYYNQHREAHQRLEAAKAEVQRLRPLLLENPDREMMGKYFNAVDVIKNAKKTKVNAIKNQYKIDFE